MYMMVAESEDADEKRLSQHKKDDNNMNSQQALIDISFQAETANTRQTKSNSNQQEEEEEDDGFDGITIFLDVKYRN